MSDCVEKTYAKSNPCISNSKWLLVRGVVLVTSPSATSALHNGLQRRRGARPGAGASSASGANRRGICGAMVSSQSYMFDVGPPPSCSLAVQKNSSKETLWPLTAMIECLQQSGRRITDRDQRDAPLEQSPQPTKRQITVRTVETTVNNRFGRPGVLSGSSGGGSARIRKLYSSRTRSWGESTCNNRGHPSSARVLNRLDKLSILQGTLKQRGQKSEA